MDMNQTTRPIAIRSGIPMGKLRAAISGTRGKIVTSASSLTITKEKTTPIALPPGAGFPQGRRRRPLFVHSSSSTVEREDDRSGSLLDVILDESYRSSLNLSGSSSPERTYDEDTTSSNDCNNYRRLCPSLSSAGKAYVVLGRSNAPFRDTISVEKTTYEGEGCHDMILIEDDEQSTTRITHGNLEANYERKFDHDRPLPTSSNGVMRDGGANELWQQQFHQRMSPSSPDVIEPTRRSKKEDARSRKRLLTESAKLENEAEIIRQKESPIDDLIVNTPTSYNDESTAEVIVEESPVLTGDCLPKYPAEHLVNTTNSSPAAKEVSDTTALALREILLAEGNRGQMSEKPKKPQKKNSVVPTPMIGQRKKVPLKKNAAAISTVDVDPRLASLRDYAYKKIGKKKGKSAEREIQILQEVDDTMSGKFGRPAASFLLIGSNRQVKLWPPALVMDERAVPSLKAVDKRVRSQVDFCVLCHTTGGQTIRCCTCLDRAHVFCLAIWVFDLQESTPWLCYRVPQRCDVSQLPPTAEELCWSLWEISEKQKDTIDGPKARDRLNFCCPICTEYAATGTKPDCIYCGTSEHSEAIIRCHTPRCQRGIHSFCLVLLEGSLLFPDGPHELNHFVCPSCQYADFNDPYIREAAVPLLDFHVSRCHQTYNLERCSRHWADYNRVLEDAAWAASWQSIGPQFLGPDTVLYWPAEKSLMKRRYVCEERSPQGAHKNKMEPNRSNNVQPSAQIPSQTIALSNAIVKPSQGEAPAASSMTEVLISLECGLRPPDDNRDGSSGTEGPGDRQGTTNAYLSQATEASSTIVAEPHSARSGSDTVGTEGMPSQRSGVREERPGYAAAYEECSVRDRTIHTMTRKRRRQDAGSDHFAACVDKMTQAAVHSPTEPALPEVGSAYLEGERTNRKPHRETRRSKMNALINKNPGVDSFTSPPGPCTNKEAGCTVSALRHQTNDFVSPSSGPASQISSTTAAAICNGTPKLIPASCCTPQKTLVAQWRALGCRAYELSQDESGKLAAIKPGSAATPKHSGKVLKKKLLQSLSAMIQSYAILGTGTTTTMTTTQTGGVQTSITTTTKSTSNTSAGSQEAGPSPTPSTTNSGIDELKVAVPGSEANTCPPSFSPLALFPSSFPTAIITPLSPLSMEPPSTIAATAAFTAFQNGDPIATHLSKLRRIDSSLHSVHDMSHKQLASIETSGTQTPSGSVHQPHTSGRQHEPQVLTAPYTVSLSSNQSILHPIIILDDSDDDEPSRSCQGLQTARAASSIHPSENDTVPRSRDPSELTTPDDSFCSQSCWPPSSAAPLLLPDHPQPTDPNLIDLNHLGETTDVPKIITPILDPLKFTYPAHALGKAVTQASSGQPKAISHSIPRQIADIGQQDPRGEDVTVVLSSSGGTRSPSTDKNTRPVLFQTNPASSPRDQTQSQIPLRSMELSVILEGNRPPTTAVQSPGVDASNGVVPSTAAEGDVSSSCRRSSLLEALLPSKWKLEQVKQADSTCASNTTGHAAGNETRFVQPRCPCHPRLPEKDPRRFSPMSPSRSVTSDSSVHVVLEGISAKTDHTKMECTCQVNGDDEALLNQALFSVIGSQDPYMKVQDSKIRYPRSRSSENDDGAIGARTQAKKKCKGSMKLLQQLNEHQKSRPMKSELELQLMLARQYGRSFFIANADQLYKNLILPSPSMLGSDVECNLKYLDRVFSLSAVVKYLFSAIAREFDEIQCGDFPHQVRRIFNERIVRFDCSDDDCDDDEGDNNTSTSHDQQESRGRDTDHLKYQFETASPSSASKATHPFTMKPLNSGCRLVSNRPPCEPISKGTWKTQQGQVVRQQATVIDVDYEPTYLDPEDPDSSPALRGISRIDEVRTLKLPNSYTYLKPLQLSGVHQLLLILYERLEELVGRDYFRAMWRSVHCGLVVPSGKELHASQRRDPNVGGEKRSTNDSAVTLSSVPDTFGSMKSLFSSWKALCIFHHRCRPLVKNFQEFLMQMVGYLEELRKTAQFAELYLKFTRRRFCDDLVYPPLIHPSENLMKISQRWYIDEVTLRIDKAFTRLGILPPVKLDCDIMHGGFFLRAALDIPAYTILGEYSGVLEARRWNSIPDQDCSDSVYDLVMHRDSRRGLGVAPEPYTNFMRLVSGINNYKPGAAQKQNCHTMIVPIDCEQRLFVVTTQPISTNDVLYLDYNAGEEPLYPTENFT